MDTLTSTEEVFIEWTAPITPDHHRSVRWYVIAGSVITLCVIYGILQDALSFAFVAVLVGIVYLLLHKHAPPNRRIALTTHGVTLKNRSVAWSELKGYWFLQTTEYTELHFVVKKAHLPDLIIQTGTQDIAVLHELLQSHLPELTEQKERILDTFIRICKL